MRRWNQPDEEEERYKQHTGFWHDQLEGILQRFPGMGDVRGFYLVGRILLFFMGMGNTERGTHLWDRLLVHFCASGARDI